MRGSSLLWTAYCLLASMTYKGFAVRCVQCLSTLDPDCLEHPPGPQPCNGSDMKFCIVITERSPQGSLLRLTRTCSPDDVLTEECDNGVTDTGERVRVCHKACDRDGCNRAPTSAKDASPLLILLALVSCTQRLLAECN